MENNRRRASTWLIPLVFAILYALWPILGLPRPYYAPEGRDLFWSKPSGVLVMGWYGRLLMAGVAAIVLGSPLAWWLNRRPKPWHRFGPWLAAVGVVMGLVITAVYEIARWVL